MKNANTTYISVFLFPADLEPERYAKYYSSARRERLAEFSHEGARQQSAAAELAYRAVLKLAEAGGLINAGDCEEYTYMKNGRPVAEKGFLSLSHTDGAVAAAFSLKPVGVDIEKRKQLNPIMAGRLLSDDELAEYKNSDSKNDMLLSSWAAKESLLKLIGEGLGGGLERIQLDRASGMMKHPDGAEARVTFRDIALACGADGENVEAAEESAILAVCADPEAEISVTVFKSLDELLKRISDN